MKPFPAGAFLATRHCVCWTSRVESAGPRLAMDGRAMGAMGHEDMTGLTQAVPAYSPSLRGSGQAHEPRPLLPTTTTWRRCRQRHGPSHGPAHGRSALPWRKSNMTSCLFTVSYCCPAAAATVHPPNQTF